MVIAPKSEPVKDGSHITGSNPNHQERFAPMAEANHRLQQTPNAAQARTMSIAVIALARQRAIKATKLQFQRQGLKPNQMARRVIVAAAKDYLGNHPELIAEAKVIVECWLAEGLFGKRAPRAWASEACIKQPNIEQSQIEGSGS